MNPASQPSFEFNGARSQRLWVVPVSAHTVPRLTTVRTPCGQANRDDGAPVRLVEVVEAPADDPLVGGEAA
jgi:hypothetical protein